MRVTETAQTKRKDKPQRIGHRVTAWSVMTNTSRITTWRRIKEGKLRTVDYFGVTLVLDTERARLGFVD